MATKLSKVKLHELSLVDHPANPGAHVSIFKRSDTPPIAGATDTNAQGSARGLFHALTKSLMDEGAVNFAAVYRDQIADRELWPMVDALQRSIQSILTDDSLSEADRMSRAEASVGEFMSAVRTKMPAKENEVAKALLAAAGSTGSQPVAKGDNPMTDKPTVEDLQKSIDTLTKRAETAETIAKMSDAEKAHMSKLDEAKKTAFMGMSADDRAKAVKKSTEDDETVVVAGETIAKSAVGPAAFNVMKAQAQQIEDIQKAAAADRDNAQMVTLTKRAEDELGNLPGEAVAKAKVLKAADAMDAETKATFDAMLKAANSALAKAFKLDGVKKGAEPDMIRKADDKVSEIMKRDKVSKSRAMEITANEAPELFNQAAA